MLVRQNITRHLPRLLAAVLAVALAASLSGCSSSQPGKSGKGSSSSSASGAGGISGGGESSGSSGGGGFSSPPPLPPRKHSSGGGGGFDGGSSSGGGGGSSNEDAPLYAAQQESAILGCTQSCTRQATQYAVDNHVPAPSGTAISETCEYHCECVFSQIANSIPYDDYRRALRGEDGDTLGAIQGIVDGCANSGGAYWIDPALGF